VIAAFVGLNPIPQYKVGPYRIDLYFEAYKIALECDENGHCDLSAINEQERQQFIEQNLGCTFIRFNPDEEGFNIGNIIAELHTCFGFTSHVHTTVTHKSIPPAAVLPNVQTKNPELLTIKPCSHCNTEKLLNEFNIAKEHRDGRENVCKKCKRIRQAKVLSEQRANTDFPNEKSCNLCNVTKPLNDFHNDKLAPDGHMRRCKDCHNEKQKKPKTLVVITEKCCASCKDIKPITDYYRHSRSKDGYAFYCRICSQIKGRANYAKDKGKTKGTTTEDSND
jgi:hypothetical protein